MGTFHTTYILIMNDPKLKVDHSTVSILKTMTKRKKVRRKES